MSRATPANPMEQTLPPERPIPLPRGDFSPRNLALVGGLTILALLVMGYHPGLEDDAFYLAAIKRDLNPALFPRDADFFRLQFQATIFDHLIAASVRLSHLPLMEVVLSWQIAAVFLVLHGCWRISRRCFLEPEPCWASTALIAALLTLPLPGIAIAIADQYLHPRTLATAAILAAIVAVIDQKPWLALALLLVAFAVHAIMASLGISFCLFLGWSLRGARRQRPGFTPLAAAVFVPLGWMFEPASEAWRQAAATRGFYFLNTWHWYEWLGVFAPLAILAGGLRLVRSPQQNPLLPRLLRGLLWFGCFQTVVGLALMLPPRLERLRPFEPMRYLQLLYLLFLLVSGGVLGQFVLKRHAYRWALLFGPLSVGMLYAQCAMYPSSSHLEWPWRRQNNAWLEAFDWVGHNTPAEALFALDPHYQTLPGEDHHGFRSLAERSTLADVEKDGGMAARVPELAPRWLREVTALNRWRTFQAADFERLRREFGVNWVVLSGADAAYGEPDPAIMTCPYSNQEVKVCRLR